MKEHTLRVLEYDKIITIAAGYAVSAPGKTMLAGFLPDSDVSAVKTRLEETREFTRLLQSGERPALDGIRDIRPAIERLRIAGSALSPAELFDIATTLASSRRVKSFFERFESRGAEAGLTVPLLGKKASGIRPLKHLEDKVFGAIDEKAGVKDSASPGLRRIRKQISRTRDEIMNRMSRILQNSDHQKVIQEPVITMRDDRYVLPLKPNFRQSLKGVVHGQSSSHATLFVEPLDILDQNNRLAELKIAEREEIERILLELTSMLSQDMDAIDRNFRIAAEIDAVCGRARFGLEYGGTVPEISTDGRVRLRNARHPLLVWKFRTSANGKDSGAVPNDVALGGVDRVLIISGPNAGGKTVILKTAGLLCLMAQAGLPITASEGSEVPVFGSVFADIGDEQSLEQSLSTFSSHVSRLSEILNDAGSDTLVLLDELGAGTDPAEGAALGAAVLESLLKRGCVVITTTHHNNLKLFGSRTSGVMNAAMEFDPETLKPTYRFIPGRPGRSYGLSMAARLGVPDDVIQNAQSRLSRDEARLEHLLEQIEKDSRQIELQKELSGRELAQARQDRAAADAELRAAKDEARSIFAKAREDAREVLAALRRKLRELSQARALEQAEAKKTAAEVETLGRRLKQIEPGERPGPAASAHDIKAGERVRIPRINKTGTVLALQKGMLELEVDGIKLKLPAEEVMPVEGVPPVQKADVSPGWGAEIDDEQELPASLNIIGLHVDEAVSEVDRYIDRSSLCGRSFATIVHGLGTGALKSAVTDFLKTHPLVVRIRPGESAEGGAGVTVAELRK